MDWRTVLKFVRLFSYIIRLQWLCKLYGQNCFPAFQLGFTNAMHSIHDTTLTAQNDWMGKVSLIYLPSVLGYLFASSFLTVVKPVTFFKFFNFR